MKRLTKVLLCSTLLIIAWSQAGLSASLVFEDYGFAINELKVDLANDGSVHQALTMTMPKPGASTPNVSVVIQRYNGSLDTCVRVIKQQMINLGRSITSEITSDQGYAILQISGANQDKPVHWYMRIQLGNGKLYLVTAFAEESQWPLVSEQLIATVSSFRVLGEPLVNTAELTREDFNGPEALSWLSSNKNRSALASNRFNGTETAIEFVKHLYALGAVRVIVPDETISSDKSTIEEEGGPYADALVVFLPTEQHAREALVAICKIEVENEGFDAEGDPGDYIFLWWD